MKKSRILLVGAGQLGSRYLQGLALCDVPMDITIVDASEESLSVASDRYEESKVDQRHDVCFSRTLDSVDRSFDISIIATPASCRAQIIEDIIARTEVKYWILEKLLSQNSEDLYRIQSALASKGSSWVNTPRRLMEWHQNLKKKLFSDGNVVAKVKVSGGSWGLATNAIHFIDLASWWTESEVDSVNALGLSAWEPSKRPGYFEAYGAISIRYKNGSVLELSCDHTDEKVIIEIDDGNTLWTIDESDGKAWSSNCENIDGEIQFQSVLTPHLISRLITRQTCLLPSLDESIKMHDPLLESLLKSWNSFTSSCSTIAPVT